MPRGLSDAANRFLDALVLTCLKENPLGISCQDIMFFAKTKRDDLPRKTGGLSLPIGRIGQHLKQLYLRGIIEKVCIQKCPYSRGVQVWRLQEVKNK